MTFERMQILPIKSYAYDLMCHFDTFWQQPAME
jgi:hypothetical protein